MQIIEQYVQQNIFRVTRMPSTQFTINFYAFYNMIASGLIRSRKLQKNYLPTNICNWSGSTGMVEAIGAIWQFLCAKLTCDKWNKSRTTLI